MAKRTRGSSRPGQRRPQTQTKQQPRTARPAAGLSDAEAARAAELESQMIARDRQTATAVASARGGRQPELPARQRGLSPLAVRAAEEYGYVSRDVRRILKVGGSMVGILVVFAILIDVLRVITL